MRRLWLLACLAFLLAGCSEDRPASSECKASACPVKTDDELPPCCTVPGRSAILGKKAPATVDLREARLKEVLADVARHKDQIVVIDIWGDFCLPCKAEFPHLVKLHKAHAKDGLICMSISVDDIKDKDKAHEFLKKQSATFANYILTADSENWQDHWNITAVPAVVVYHNGKVARTFTNDDPDNQFTYADVEKYLAKLRAPR